MTATREAFGRPRFHILRIQAIARACFGFELRPELAQRKTFGDSKPESMQAFAEGDGRHRLNWRRKSGRHGFHSDYRWSQSEMRVGLSWVSDSFAARALPRAGREKTWRFGMTPDRNGRFTPRNSEQIHLLLESFDEPFPRVFRLIVARVWDESVFFAQASHELR